MSRLPPQHNPLATFLSCYMSLIIPSRGKKKLRRSLQRPLHHDTHTVCTQMHSLEESRKAGKTDTAIESPAKEARNKSKRQNHEGTEEESKFNKG